MFLYSTGNINSIAESLKIWSILILFGFRNFALAYLLKCIRNPQINTHSAFTVIHRDVQSGDRLEPADVHVLSWGQIRWHSAFWFQVTDYKPVSLYLMPHCPHFPTFYWWFCCLKWPSSIALNCWFLFLSTWRLWRAYRKNICYICFFQAWVTVLFVLNSMSMNQQSVLNKVSLNKNTHRRRLYIDQLMKMWPVAHGNLTLYFP